MSNIEAALLLPQFDRLKAKLERRHTLAEQYARGFAGMRGIRLPSSRPDCVHARHLYTVWCEDLPRDELMTHLHRERIGAVVNYRPIHLMSYFVKRYGYRRGDFPVAERIGDCTISLPFYPDMPLHHVDAVVEAVRRFFGRSRQQHRLTAETVTRNGGL